MILSKWTEKWGRVIGMNSFLRGFFFTARGNEKFENVSVVLH